MPTILVVEEEEVIRGLVRVVLESAGYDVIEAGDGEAGYQLAKRSSVDAIVLDCMGRIGNGIRALRQLRGDANTAHLPVVALCGLGQSGAEIGLWANSLVVKPFRPAQLLMKVQMTMASRIEAARTQGEIQPRASA